MTNRKNLEILNSLYYNEVTLFAFFLEKRQIPRGVAGGKGCSTIIMDLGMKGKLAILPIIMTAGDEPAQAENCLKGLS